MFKGFYTLTSGMLTQQRKLNTISNNMANVATPGYKKDVLATRTFEEVLAHRTGSIDKRSPAELASVTMIRTPDEFVTNFEQGITEETRRPFDVALLGDGFFEIQTPEGDFVYTRNGSFTLDDEGYLYLQHIGRVMGQDGLPILLGTDKIRFDAHATILSTEDNNAPIAALRVVAFADNSLLEKAGEGMFDAANAGAGVNVVAPRTMGGALERSNVNPGEEMVAMITSQRGLQSASQILKMMDQIMQRAANDIGRL